MPLNKNVRPEILDSVALLIVDAQDCLIDSLADPDRFRRRTAFAIEAARSLRIHTLFTEQAPEKLGHTNAELLKLAPNPKVFPKHCFSALGAPSMERYLRNKEIYHLIVAGLEVPICIYQTGLQATDEDIDITFLSDCLGSRRPEDEGPALDSLKGLGCQVLPSESVYYGLLGDSLNPYFRAFSQVVKAFGKADFDLARYFEERTEPASEDKAELPPREKEPIGQEPPRSQKRKGNRRRGKGNDSRDRQATPRDDPQSQARAASARPSQPAKANQPETAPEAKPLAPASRSKAANEAEALQDKAEPPESKPAPQGAEEPDAKPKKPAKKAAKKAAKKTARKTAKKTAKKAAKRAAKKTAAKEEPSE